MTDSEMKFEVETMLGFYAAMLDKLCGVETIISGLDDVNIQKMVQGDDAALKTAILSTIVARTLDWNPVLGDVVMSKVVDGKFNELAETTQYGLLAFCLSSHGEYHNVHELKDALKQSFIPTARLSQFQKEKLLSIPLVQDYIVNWPSDRTFQEFELDFDPNTLLNALDEHDFDDDFGDER